MPGWLSSEANRQMPTYFSLYDRLGRRHHENDSEFDLAITLTKDYSY